MNYELRIYNTLSRKKEKFRPIRKSWVGLYTCGPTVYNYAHIGNLRTYIFEDILHRTLEWNGYKVKRVMNITDVGHLTSDADEGEDKVEKEAKKEKKSVWAIAAFYTKKFFQDIKELNIIKPRYIAPATKFIKEQIEIIKNLIQKGFAYETSTAIYFDVSKFKNYTKLSKQKISQKITAAREGVVADPEKRLPQDFVLWFKLVGRFKNHIMRWPSPWGLGFPGWHIECSAISTKFLGQPFDIHTGGVDHIAVHHTNEIAQSEAAFGEKLANYWLHGEFLVIKDERMGKSAGNFITLTEVKKRGFHPLAYRYFVLSAHYRSKLNFSWEALKSAQNSLINLQQQISLLKKKKYDQRKKTFKKTTKIAGRYIKKFAEAINDDLNTPIALAILWQTLKDKKIDPMTKIKLVLTYDKILGLGLRRIKKPSPIPPKIMTLVKTRELFRINKQFIRADALRNQIKRLGYEIEDTPFGPYIKKSQV